MKTAFDIVVDLWGTLTQVGPLIGSLAEAVLVGTLCTPDHTCRGARGIKASMWTMAFVGVTKLTVDFGAKFTGSRCQ